MIPLHEKLDDITCGGTEVRVIAQGLVLEDGWAEAADERVALKQGEVTAIAFLADHVPWAADTQC